MDIVSASLGTTLDEIYRRLVDCYFGQEEPEMGLFLMALMNAKESEGSVIRPMEMLLLLAYGDYGIAQRASCRLTPWQPGWTRMSQLSL